MTKVVVNRCFGGFSLSEAGVRLYAKLKGLTVYPERDGVITTYWTVPAGQRSGVLEGAAWDAASTEARQASNAAYGAMTITDTDIPRDDHALVETVEALDDAANGPFAKLEVVEIPDDVAWHIHEYDGSEHVAENHRTW